MANPPPPNHAELTPERQTPPTTPRWVKIVGIVAVVVVVLFVVLQFTGGGHGPGRHLPTNTTNTTSPANVTEHPAHQP